MTNESEVIARRRPNLDRAPLPPQALSPMSDANERTELEAKMKKMKIHLSSVQPALKPRPLAWQGNALGSICGY